MQGAAQRKRHALRHALRIQGTPAQKQHAQDKRTEMQDAALAIATHLEAAGEHMPCRWVAEAVHVHAALHVWPFF